MTRALLNALPEWMLFILFLIVPVTASLVGAHVSRRYFPTWKHPASQETVGTVIGVVSTFFALVLAFAIVNLYQRYEDASYRVDATAASLVVLSHEAAAFPAAEKKQMNAAIGAYTTHLATVILPGLRKGSYPPGSAPGLGNLYRVLEAYHPTTPAEVSFYDASIAELGTVLSNEQQFVSDGTSSLPGAFLALLAVTAILTFLASLLLSTESRAFELALTASISAAIGIGWLTVAILEYPFSGTVSVSTAAFTHGFLHHLATLHH